MKPSVSTRNGMLWGYKWHLGMVNWLFHRISGLALIFYLTAHVFVVRGFKNAVLMQDAGQTEAALNKFGRLAAVLENPVFVIAEILILSAVLFHTFNGIRVMFVDFFNGARYEKTLNVILWVAFLAILIPSGLLMLISIF